MVGVGRATWGRRLTALTKDIKRSIGFFWMG